MQNPNKACVELLINGVESVAFKMTKRRRSDNKHWPEWLNRAWNAQRGDPGSVWNEIACTLKGYLVVTTSTKHHSRVLWGDYIVKSGAIIWHCPRRLFDLILANAPVHTVAVKGVADAPVLMRAMQLVPGEDCTFDQYRVDINVCMRVINDFRYEKLSRGCLRDNLFVIECEASIKVALQEHIERYISHSSLVSCQYKGVT